MSNRRLEEKAEKIRIQKANPSLWTGLRKPGQPSKIFNRAEAEAEYQSDIQAARILTERRAAELEGAAPAGQGAAPAGQGAAPTSRLDASPTPGLDAAPASRLDASPTPGLDAQRPSPTSAAAPKRETFAEADARTRREKTLSGAFGEQAQKRAENLQGRQGLFAEMKASSQKSGGDIPMEDMTRFGEQAKKLGIADENFEKTAFRVEGGKSPAPTAPAPAAPLTGRALAEKNIATMGQAGAAADYFKRAEAEKAALEKRSPLNTVSSRFTEKAGTPAPESRKTFGQMFGYAMDQNEPSPAATANTKPAVPISTPTVSVKPTAPTKPRSGSVYSSGTTMDTQQNRVRLASEAADKRMKEGDALIQRRRNAQSSGIFPRDSILGGVTRWLQNDNFSTK